MSYPSRRRHRTEFFSQVQDPGKDLFAYLFLVMLIFSFVILITYEQKVRRMVIQESPKEVSQGKSSLVTLKDKEIGKLVKREGEIYLLFGEKYYRPDREIALLEKAGIIKRDGIVITGVKQRRALEVIKEVCRKKRARLFLLGKDIKVQQVNLKRNANDFCDFQKLDYQGILDSFRGLKIKLLGRHQIENAALALGAIEGLRLRGIQVAENRLRKGLEEATWPGRLEVLNCVNRKGEDCKVVLDGAHNPAAMRSLKNALLEDIIPHRRLILVLGILKDKDVKKIVAEIAPICQEVVVTSPKTERGFNKNLLGKEVMNYLPSKRVRVEDGVGEALRRALEIANRDDLICVSGSLYTVGEARSVLKL